jgi:hypothetical protein
MLPAKLRIPLGKRGRIEQQYPAKINCRMLRVNHASESLLDEIGQTSRMIDMTMTQNHGINRRRSKRKGLLVEELLCRRPLYKTAIQKNRIFTHSKNMARTGHSLCCAIKLNFHNFPPQISSKNDFRIEQKKAGKKFPA